MFISSPGKRVKPIMLENPTLTFTSLSTDTCRVPKVMRNVTNDCHKFANIIYEEHRDFGIGWDESLAGKRPYNLKEYRYRTSGSLDSYPFWGDIAWYGGGG